MLQIFVHGDSLRVIRCFNDSHFQIQAMLAPIATGNLDSWVSDEKICACHTK